MDHLKRKMAGNGGEKKKEVSMFSIRGGRGRKKQVKKKKENKASC